MVEWMIRGWTCFLLIAMATGCHRSCILDVSDQYLDCRDLASSYVGTPDLRRECGFCGQQIMIHWNLPKTCRGLCDLHAQLTLRTRCQGVQEIIIPICHLRGSYLYRLLNRDYEESGGIVSYKVEVRSEGRCLATWAHQVWAEWIEIGDE